MIKKKRKGILVVIGLWLMATTGADANMAVQGMALASPAKEDLIQVSIHNLVVDPSSRQPVVSLTDPDEKRALLIWIGPSEASAIYAELQGIKHSRPLTHDLLAGIIKKVDGKIHHIVITHTQENIFYAIIVIEKDSNLVEVDSRPSDSIVMALKFEAPIFVSRALFEKMSIPIKEPAGIAEKYGLTLQALTPELAKYLSFKSDHGVMVSRVHKDSQAETDGIETGDIIVKIGGQPVDSVLSMKDALIKNKTPMKVRIFRKSRFLAITIYHN
ncbi:MAG: PDZ domain-containing protein [Desulfobacterales bacterium]|nr:PDZ domain-containing protein [Desulfobacterales bacterium]